MCHYTTVAIISHRMSLKNGSEALEWSKRSKSWPQMTVFLNRPTWCRVLTLQGGIINVIRTNCLSLNWIFGTFPRHVKTLVFEALFSLNKIWTTLIKVWIQDILSSFGVTCVSLCWTKRCAAPYCNKISKINVVDILHLQTLVFTLYMKCYI